MAESPVFAWVSGELERRTVLSHIEARGTVRLVLKDAGLEPASVTVEQISVVLRRLMAGALAKRRVEHADEICEDILRALKSADERGGFTDVESAYDVFQRLGGDEKEGEKP